MIRYFPEIEQGSDEWLAVRRGILTASEMKKIITPGGKQADNETSRRHVLEMLAQRITGHVEPQYISDDMLRGHEDEILARAKYAEHYAPVTECGFVTRDFGGFVLGYSPDGLVLDDGQIEIKSRRQKYQVETILADEVPAEYMLQIQAGLLVTGRRWLDFISYSAGLPMFVKRVWPDELTQEAIVTAAHAFEQRKQIALEKYGRMLAAMPVLIPTERTIEQEIFA